jgi:threonine dehydrogenase-like Zn-dependent dehydrogenase
MEAWRFSVTVPQWIALKALGAINRRLYYQGPLATAKWVDIPEPDPPQGKWVRLRTLMCGFCASDLNLIFLRDSPTASPFTSFPAVFGHEIVAEVESLGPDAAGFKVGDRVAVAPGLGCAAREIDPICRPCERGLLANCENYAEGRLAPGMFTGICQDTGAGFSPLFLAHESQLHPLPPELPTDIAVLTEPLSVAIQAVWGNRPQAGENLLVIGGGVIGGLIVQALRAFGFDGRLAVMDPSPLSGELCRKFGADAIIDDGDLFGASVRLTGARRYQPMMGADILMGGFDRVYDTVATTRTLNTAMRSMAAGGTLSVVGIGHDVHLDLTPLWLKHQTLTGVFGCGMMETDQGPRHMFDVAIDWALAGRVQLEGMVTHRFGLDALARIIETNLAKARRQAVKTVVSFV